MTTDTTNEAATDGLVIDIDPDTLTIDECEVIEDRTGLAIADLFVAGKRPSAKQLRALAFVALRRADPKATWEQAGTVRMTELSMPTEAGDVPPT